MADGTKAEWKLGTALLKEHETSAKVLYERLGRYTAELAAAVKGEWQPFVHIDLVNLVIDKMAELKPKADAIAAKEAAAKEQADGKHEQQSKRRRKG